MDRISEMIKRGAENLYKFTLRRFCDPEAYLGTEMGRRFYGASSPEINGRRRVPAPVTGDPRKTRLRLIRAGTSNLYRTACRKYAISQKALCRHTSVGGKGWRIAGVGIRELHLR